MSKLKIITLEFLIEKIENEEPIQLVEALSPEEYNKGHLPGAVNIPQNKVSEMAKDLLKKDKPIITYCAGYTCKASSIVARKLMDLGYDDVYDFKGGKPVWKDAGFELKQKIAQAE